MSDKKEWWYFTFGVGQKHGGHYVKIAGTFDEARDKMIAKYSDKWCWQYSEYEWEKMKNDPNRRYELETELEVIDEMKSATTEFLVRTAVDLTDRFSLRPRIYCKDGFNMSVQASEFHYCYPRECDNPELYETVEVGFPSEAEPLLKNFAENMDSLTETVYPYTPIEVVDEVIEKHGGIKL